MATSSRLRFRRSEDEVVIDLAAAQEDALHLGRIDGVVGNDALERARSRGRRAGSTASGCRRSDFGREDDERLAPGALHLAAEHVEELRGRREVADLDVVLGRELQEALDARARVLRPLALEAVRQEQDEPAEPRPLVLGGHDELIDDDLRGVRRSRRTAPPTRRACPADRASSRTRSRARRPRSAESRRSRNARR